MSETATLPVTSPEDLLTALRHRYAVKKFDPTGKLPREVWQALEEALVLAPSSYGLQPWKFFVVDDPGTRAKLRKVSWGQSQITDADKLVVFAVRSDYGAADVEHLLDRISEVRHVDKEALASYKEMILGSISRPAEQVEAWLARQVYIALGVFLASAAALGVDACPMEGFEKSEYDAILGLPKRGWKAVVVATAGVRAADDAYANAEKVRFPLAEVVQHL
jgi:nitroreductase